MKSPSGSFSVIARWIILHDFYHLPQPKFNHENGVFGSYCLEDIKSIDNFVYKKLKNTYLSYDCFNFETVSELIDENEINGKNKAADQIRNLYQKNFNFLTKMQSRNELSFHLHYADRPNDLMQTRKQVVDLSNDWDKFNRYFQKNMFFFNPYLDNVNNTAKLMKRFFSYARTNLNKDGVVTLMWNYNRKDSLKHVKIVEIAKEKGFTVIKKLSGEQYASLTNFKHLKNSTSLAKVIEENSIPSSVFVSPKKSDLLIMFKKINSSPKIPADNVIATLLAESLSEINVSIG